MKKINNYFRTHTKDYFILLLDKSPLTDKEYRVAEDFYLHGLSYVDIGEKYNMSNASVNKVMTRIRSILSNMIDMEEKKE